MTPHSPVPSTPPPHDTIRRLCSMARGITALNPRQSASMGPEGRGAFHHSMNIVRRWILVWALMHGAIGLLSARLWTKSIQRVMAWWKGIIYGSTILGVFFLLGLNDDLLSSYEWEAGVYMFMSGLLLATIATFLYRSDEVITVPTAGSARVDD